MLITFDEVADALGVSPGDASLIRLVKSTDVWAKRSLGRRFELDTYTLHPRGFGGNTIWLRESPIRSLTEIRVDPYGDFGDDTIVSDLTQFRFNPDPFDDDNKLTFAGYGSWSTHPILGSYRWPFPELPNAIRVVLEAGWYAADDTDHESDLPDDLREKLIERVCAKYKQGSDEELSSERQGDRSITKFKQTDARILEELRRYKR